ncbi:hypothetical protein [Euzebya sp.]|uniref:hypothetical protein n=1 Tax=Euzebya sp. TaxID=1971409 RepID=UPI003516EAC1
MPRVAAAIVVLLVVFGAGVATGLWLERGSGPEAEDVAAAPPTPGSVVDPIPRGRSADVGVWALRVVDSDDDAAERIAAANQFNAPPPEGHRQVMVEVVLERRGRGPAVVRGTITAALGTPAGRTFPLGQDCGILPDPLDTGQPVRESQEIRGQWCWVVPEEELAKIRLEVAGTGGGSVWFRL